MLRLVLMALLVSAAPHAGGDPVSPYQGQESREIKALSGEETSALLAGEGMGFAKAAELNGYPGPKHVLELADRLDLSPSQLEKTRSIHGDMKSRAIDTGRVLLEAERELDRRFREKTIDAEALQDLLTRIASLRTELRRVHLQAHLEQTKLLSDAQVAAYAELRGYSHTPGNRHAHH